MPTSPAKGRNGANGHANGRAPARRRKTDPAFAVAYVRYHDHCWLEADELDKIRKAGPYVVEETGFLLVETAEYVTLAKERSTDGERGRVRYGDVTIIMKSDILDFQVMGTPTVTPASGARPRVRTSKRRP